MDTTLKLCYAMEKKCDRIIKYKKSLRRSLGFLYAGYLCLCVIILPFILKNRNSSFSGMFAQITDPNAKYSFQFLLTISIIILLSGLSTHYNQLKKKYEILRHDIIKDTESASIPSRICMCNERCNCRETFIKEMEKLDIDIVFKKHLPDQKNQS